MSTAKSCYIAESKCTGRPSMRAALPHGIRQALRQISTQHQPCAHSSAQASMVHYPAAHQALIPAPELHLAAGGEAANAERSAEMQEQDYSVRRIFCNRTLDLGQMEAIGFDMVRIIFERCSHAPFRHAWCPARTRCTIFARHARPHCLGTTIQPVHTAVYAKSSTWLRRVVCVI